MPEVIENIVRVSSGWGFDVRLWAERSAEGPAPSQHFLLLSAAVSDVGRRFESGDPYWVARAIVDRLYERGVTVNAIEVMFENSGTLIYPEWP